MRADRPLRLARIAQGHLAGVMAVQAKAYGGALLESADVLGSKLRTPGGTCWGTFADAAGSLTDRASSPDPLPAGAVGEGSHFPPQQGVAPAGDALALCAYAIAHAVPQGTPLVLNKPLRDPRPPAAGDWLYVHDIAVDPAWAGHGLAARLLGEVLNAGRRASLQRAMLVAVQGAEVYWARHGFVAQRPPMPLSGFGQGAVWMARDL